MRWALVALAALVLAPAAGGTSTAFSANVTNPWFPLRPGETHVFTGTQDGDPVRDVFRVTHRVARIAGVPCVVVDDRLYVRGKLAERTTDWYSQDAKGNVWYFGENTAELDGKGRVVSTEGTWRAGVHGARPGFYMPASPRVGQVFGQEQAEGVAEDRFRVVSVGATVLETNEWTPLEPGVLDRKTYTRTIGTSSEDSLKGGDEHLKLVTVRKS